MNLICVNNEERKKFKLSLLNSKWKSVDDNPPTDNEFVIVLYRSYANSYFEHYEQTVAKFDGCYWTDCLNLTNTDLHPIYWRPFPGVDE